MNWGRKSICHFLWLFIAMALLLTCGKPLVAAGGGWVRQNPITTNNLRNIWGSSKKDIFAVGLSGTILHYDGTIWSLMASGTTEHLTGIWGSSGTDVFAVGTGGTILHYDGTIWSLMASGTTEHLSGIWGNSGTDVFAVGPGSTILHYDGSVWSTMSSGTTYRLWGIWGSTGTDVFAVGEQGTILHYNGNVWSKMSSGTDNMYILGIWGSSGTDVFAVGFGGYRRILHYDGHFWSNMTSETTYALYGIWGSSGTDVFAVGTGGTILRYDGKAWSPMTSGTTQLLTSIWGSTGTDVFAVGEQGTILRSLGFSLFLPLVIYVEPNCVVYTEDLRPYTECNVGVGWLDIGWWKATTAMNATKLEVASKVETSGTNIRIKVNNSTIAEWYAGVGLNVHKENISASISPGDTIYFSWGNGLYGCFSGIISVTFCTADGFITSLLPQRSPLILR
jgi:hypothetical protein